MTSDTFIYILTPCTKRSLPYPSDSAKRQIGVMVGWGWVSKGALWRYALTTCVLFSDVESDN